ncbi:MAG: hypothetical protein E7329_10920 [Clostridiales bacterium]|nr:hypothetical protein [Clostridiales bacterium]
MMWHSYIRFRFLGKKKQEMAEVSRQKQEWDQEYRRFCCRADVVEKACALWAPENPGALARRYMAHVIQMQGDAAWWKEQGEYLDQPWFIRRYCLEHGLLLWKEAAFPPLPLRLIRPEKECRQWVLLKAERNLMAPDQGRVLLQCSYDQELYGLLKKLHFHAGEQGYEFRVDECSAPLEHRAAELGERLLLAGYGVSVEERALEKRILSGDYTPAHGYWIKETDSPECLRLLYPYDPRLHRYLCMLGARWEKKQMLLPIHCIDRLQDAIRLYDFRLTGEAKRLVAAWNSARESATVYRPRRSRQCLPAQAVDRFREMLGRAPGVLPDLEDRDE